MDLRLHLRADAERGLTETLASLDRGAYVESSRLSLERYLLDEWLPASAARIRTMTADSCRYLIKRYIVPAIGHVPLAQLTPVAVAKFYGSLLATGRVADPAASRRRRCDTSTRSCLSRC